MKKPIDVPVCNLSARIVPGDGRCRQYRFSGSASCHGCEAVMQQAQNIETREVGPMRVTGCSVEGCKSVVHARGMCWKHERSEMGIDPRTGKPLDGKAVLPVSKPHPMCKVAGCAKITQAGRDGMCKRHFSMAQREAGVLACNSAQAAEKIIKHVEQAALVQVKELIGTIPPVDFGLAAGFECKALDVVLGEKRRECLERLSSLSPVDAAIALVEMLLKIKRLEC